MKKNYVWSVLVAIVVTALIVSVSSCGSDDTGNSVPTPMPVTPVATTLTVTGADAAFSADASSASSKQVMTVTSNAAWGITSKPEWLEVTPQSGAAGTTNVEVWPNKENNTENDLKGEIVFSAGDQTVTKTITQRTNIGKAKTAPTNILVMSNGLALDFSCNSYVAYYDYQIMLTSELGKYSDKELAEYVRTSTITNRKTPSDEWIVSVSGLYANTSYTIVTVSYDSEGKQGSLVKEKVTTKSTTNYPYVQANNLQVGQSGDNYYLIWDMEGNTYLNKYYTWVVMGRTKFVSFNWADNLVAWFVYKEIKSNPTSHDTKINSKYNYTTFYEHLEGPQLKTGTEAGVAPLNLETQYIQLVAWGTDEKNELSGVLNNWTVDLTSSSSTARLMPVKRNTKNIENNNGKIVYSGISKKELSDNFIIQRF